ncbi:MAG: hypothetical protein KTR16_11950 [Acidiferrobacterales bacterium]|nr:hypothetical protein [Acidiferrobacterales bacterium]
MPHFVVDCSKSALEAQDPEFIVEEIHTAANSTGLFSPDNVQVRINAFDTHIIGGQKKDFIHVFASILEGRDAEKKKNLSMALGAKLAELFPDFKVIGVDIKDLEKGTGFNRGMLK